MAFAAVVPQLFFVMTNSSSRNASPFEFGVSLFERR
jgi:hypothetical protein